MANGWTPQRKAKQSQAIHTWRPWEQSTGPRTESGKKVSAKRGEVHGARSREFLEAQRLVRALKQKVQDDMEKYRRLQADLARAFPHD